MRKGYTMVGRIAPKAKAILLCRASQRANHFRTDRNREATMSSELTQKEKDEMLVKGIKDGQLERCRAMIEQGACLGATNAARRTPLHWASKKGHVEMVRLLLRAGADLAATDREGKTPLHVACENGCAEAIRALLEAGADIHATDKRRMTPLHWASANGDGGSIRLLLGAGTDVRAKNEDGWTPLHEASARGNIDAMRLLLEAGADARAAANDGRTPLRVARKGLCGAESFLDRWAASSEALVKAVSDERVASCRELVANGASARAADENGWTALHHAGGHAAAAALKSSAYCWGRVPK